MKRFGVVVAMGLAGSACATQLRTAPVASGALPDREQVVPYPPPAALPEVVPSAPAEERAVWVDGDWHWTGTRYVWTRGGWVVPPGKARFVPWTLRYASDGTLWFAPARWVDEQGEAIRRLRPIEPAAYPPTRRKAAQRVD